MGSSSANHVWNLRIPHKILSESSRPPSNLAAPFRFKILAKILLISLANSASGHFRSSDALQDFSENLPPLKVAILNLSDSLDDAIRRLYIRLLTNQKLITHQV